MFPIYSQNLLELPDAYPRAKSAAEGCQQSEGAHGRRQRCQAVHGLIIIEDLVVIMV